MRLHHLDVESFGCVREAHVDFGPGLNVLFGPNDLGKSTLAHSLRAVLLLPHTSKAREDFVPWGGDEKPTVTLRFSTADRRLWRVRKRWGSRGESYLESSLDGNVWGEEAKGRDVDGRLRRMLSWGIKGPGGKGGQKGLPTSFLSTVILGEQSDVAGILEQTLEEDRDESGRARLTEALQAFAQDPVFKRVLDEAERHVAAAFRKDGRKRKHRHSPFAQVSAKVNEAKATLRERREKVRESDEVRLRLAELGAKLEDAERVLRKRRAERARREQLEVGQAARRAAEEKRAAAAAELARRRKIVAEAEAAAAEVEAERAALARSAEQREALVARDEAGAEALREATAAVEALRGDEAARRRALRQREREHEATRRADAVVRQAAQVAAAEAGVAREVRGEELQREAAALEQAAAQRASRRAEAQAAVERATRELAQAAQLVRRAEREALAARVAAAERAEAEAAALRERAGALREQADELSAAPDIPLPSAQELAGLRRLARELELCEARLGGGLSLHLELERDCAVRAKVDGVTVVVPDERSLDFDAHRSLRLELAELGSLTVHAGEPEERARLKTLRARWSEEVQPRLEACGLRDLAALQRSVEQRAVALDKAQTLRTEADALEARAAVHASQAEQLPALRESLARGAPETPAAAAELDALREAWGAPGSPPFEKARRRCEGGRSKAEKKLAAIDREERQELTARARLQAALEQLAAGPAAPEGGWRAALLAHRAEHSALLASQRAQEAENAREERAEAAALAAAEGALRTATAAADEARAALAACDERRREAERRLHGREGQLSLMREQAAAVDIPAAEAALRAAEEALAALPAGEDVRPEDLEQSRREVAAAEKAAEHLRAEVLRARGALETVGGAVAHQKAEEAAEELELAEQEERAVEVDYEAWQLLADTLREAESQEGRHLGEVLAAPTGSLFSQLTDGRYGSFALDANLLSAGLDVGGSQRAVATLSLGTKEQLATLLRVTVAQALNSFLVLDDQLVQTDLERAGWFRVLLHERVEKIQTIILTCRPRDYLAAAEFPAPGQAEREDAGLHVVDLSRVIRRA